MQYLFTKKKTTSKRDRFFECYIKCFLVSTDKTFSPTHKLIIPTISYMIMGISHVIKLSHRNLRLTYILTIKVLRIFISKFMITYPLIHLNSETKYFYSSFGS